MTTPISLSFTETDIEALAALAGKIAVIVPPEGKLDPVGRRLNRLTKGALARLVEAEGFAKAKDGDVLQMAFPAGLAAEAVLVLKLARRPSVEEARKAGAALAKQRGKGALTVCAGATARVAEIGLGLALRAYDFDAHKTGDKTPAEDAAFMVSKPDEAQAEWDGLKPLAEGVFFTRDLVNEPSNVLTTVEFAERLKALAELGVDIEVLEEDELEKLGMRTLLAVGQGSESPSKVVVMQWKGGGDEAPLALIGKGVVFDTGGISIKPAAGMEDMTMDMGGAGTVAGVMKAIAGRKAKANIVALVGLVENMPDGRAQRPGDVVRSMKGDTVEVINTDAEGRLVLCDVMWYAQDRFSPSGMIDLATLTGAIIISLGHENAGVFSNDDDFCGAFLKAAKAEGEGAWRMPLGKAYDEKLKSRIADMKNVGGRDAGSITAAQFLGRFVKDGTPWIHLDIAGVASVKSDTALAPKGATGWGVLALDRLIRDRYEG
ncbi:leucyl aminopeptidase [Roseibacterium sp. SDUM158016]|uniref:leucyl aminopeptidase n=1 Tax=Roseicyclus sediminis TaxID=2980997 RepID=UPI0021D13130|nr:leucyl aminopeptidase [Roseibacterium sp. SDUM158016]MCU4653902.1 leucyl aminopeptidase [Roseibacterium sp. SDUM158016]